MSRFGVSTVVWLVWLGLFLIAELLAVFHVVPWEPLSDWIWRLEGIRRVGVYVQWIVLVGLAVLLTHLVARFPD